MDSVIKVTRLNGKELYVNCDKIEVMEETPDTVITFSTGTKIVVKEKSEEIKQAIIEYKRAIYANMVKI